MELSFAVVVVAAAFVVVDVPRTNLNIETERDVEEV